MKIAVKVRKNVKIVTELLRTWKRTVKFRNIMYEIEGGGAGHVTSGTFAVTPGESVPVTVGTGRTGLDSGICATYSNGRASSFGGYFSGAGGSGSTGNYGPGGNGGSGGGAGCQCFTGCTS